MEMTNFTFVRSSWMSTLCLALFCFGLTGFASLQAQCDAPINLGATNITGDAATLTWTSDNGDLTDHCWTITIGAAGYDCTDANQILQAITVCEGDAGLGIAGLDLNFTVNGLQPGTDYEFGLVESCDGADGNSGMCVTAAFSTLEDPFTVTDANIVAPSCPFISPGFVPDGSFDVVVADGTTCTGEFDITVTAVAGSGPGGSTPNTVVPNAVIGQPAGTYPFAAAGPGQYQVVVTENGADCGTFATNPVVITVTVPDGTDTTDPIFYVTDILGNIIVDNDPFTPEGTTANLGNLDVPEGSCSLQAQYFAQGIDNCDGFIFAPGAVTATSMTTPATVDPATQVTVTDDGFGNYLIDVNWSVGTTTLSIVGSDASGNTADLTIIATILDNTNPVVTMLGGFNFTIPQCVDEITATITVQVDDLCDQDVDLANLDFVDFAGAPFVLNFVGNNYFEYFVTIDEGDDGALWSVQYTDDFGNTGFFDVIIQVEKAAEDLPAVIIAGDENYNIPACEDVADIAYAFQILDDCADIDPNDVTFDDDGSGLVITFVDVDNDNNSAFFEATAFGGVAPGVYIPTITYQGTVLQPLINITQNANQAPDVVMPGNLNVTIPVCQLELQTVWAIQILDDCDTAGDFDINNLTVSLTSQGPLTATYNPGTGYVEISPILTAADNGALLLVSYTDSDGATTDRDALIVVNDQPDNWAPLIIYPSNDLNLEIDPCDIGGVATAFFEVTATDNCDGDLTPLVQIFGVGSAAGLIFPSPGGDTYLLIATPGVYQILITATDAAGNERQEDFFITVTQDPAPATVLACQSSINVTLDENCQYDLDPQIVLAGNFGCDDPSDYLVTVMDADPTNGQIVDGCGTFEYNVQRASDGIIEGFTGPFAPSNWAVTTDATGGTASVSFTSTTLTLATFSAGAFDGGDFDADGLNAAAAIPAPANGDLSFDYDFNGVDAGWDWFVIDIDGNILASDEFAASGSIAETVTAGEIIIIGVDDDGAAPIFSNDDTELVITDWVFEFDEAPLEDFCWGNVFAEDKTPPELTCPDDTDEVLVQTNIQLFGGTIDNTDPSLELLNFPCFFEILNSTSFPLNSNYFYETQTFTVTSADTYTFQLTGPGGGATGGGLMAIYAGDFSENEPCSNIIYQNDQVFGATTGLFLLSPGTGFATINFDPQARVSATLVPGQTYTLFTTATSPDVVGDYDYAVFSDNGGAIDLSPAPGVQPAPQPGGFTQELICEDFTQFTINSLAPNVSRCYQADANGNVINGNLPAIRPLLQLLAFTGYPANGDAFGGDVSDNCGDVEVCVTDVVNSGSDCGPSTITRTFTVVDGVNSECANNGAVSCTQVITIRKPNMQDVFFPPFTAFIECDEDYPTDANGNPSPDITGYPFLQTAGGFLDLNPTVCNLGATYEDGPRINVCTGSYKVVRLWTVLDWCNPANSRQYNQIIKVGDFTAPTIGVPTADYNNDGTNDLLTYSTGIFDCTAAFQVPLPTVSDNCSGVGSIITQIIDSDGNLVVTLNPGDNRFVGGIGLGCYTYRFVVRDGCDNESEATAPFYVVDRVAPTAVCDDDLNISAGGLSVPPGTPANVVARVSADDIDEGSSDNCGPIRIEVRRLVEEDPNTCNDVPPFFTPWGEFVDFYCCDVNDMVRIELRVWDDANGDGIPGNTVVVVDCEGNTSLVTDNSNTCWLDVLVEDKLAPFCTPPLPVTLDCNDLPFDFDANNIDQLEDLFGEATGADNCPGIEITELPPLVNLSDCGIGSIVRRFRVTDAVGNVSTNFCQQVITINEVHEYEIRFPADAEANCGTPDIDSVEVNEIGCDLLAISDPVDEFFSASGDECYKIRRTYRVINWCEYDGISEPVIIGRDEDCQDGNPGDEAIWVLVRPNEVTYLDRDNDENNNNPFFGCFGNATRGHWTNSNLEPRLNSVGFWQYTQFIKVYDNVDPIIDITQPDAFCSLSSDIDNGCPADVEITFGATDDCTPDDLTVTVGLDAFVVDGNGDGEITAGDFVFDADVTNLLTNNGDGTYTLNGNFPIGRHLLLVTVDDGCGNAAADYIVFEVVDCKAPTPICINGLAIELMPTENDMTDADGDGDFDAAAMGIWASDFIASPIVDCTPPIKYSINRVGDTPDMDQTGIVLTCDDDETTLVEIYAWDSANNPYAVQPDGTVGGPNYDFCETYVLVQDNMGLCGTDGGNIAGAIMTEESETVEGVEVSLSGAMAMNISTTAGGTYNFANLTLGDDYTVTPQLDINPLNGVSTFDLVLISKHILGVQLLDSPYKLIAADANASEAITTSDLIQLRKLILNIDTEFSSNTSWRFVDADYSFPNPANPWTETFPEVYNVNNMSSDILDADFIAVKIGDVNGSASANLLGGIEPNNFDGVMALTVADRQLAAGNTTTVEVTARELASITGYQGTLELAAGVELLDIEYGVMSAQNFGMTMVSEGQVTMSWNGEAASDEVLFSLVVRSRTDVSLSDVLSISSRYTAAEAYDRTNRTLNVAIDFGQGVVAGAAYALYQNSPNPFRGETLIKYELPTAGEATLTIHDVTGKVLQLQRQTTDAGMQQFMVNSQELGASGVLYYTLRSGEFTATKKMVVVE